MDFIEACRKGDLTRVKDLLRSEDVNPQYANNEPLEVALKNGHHDIVHLLLKDARVLQDMENLMRVCLNYVTQIEAKLNNVVH